MSDSHASAGKCIQFGFTEHFSHEPKFLVSGKNTIVIYDDTAAFLSPVLESIKPVIYIPGNVISSTADYSEYSALFMNCHCVCIPP